MTDKGPLEHPLILFVFAVIWLALIAAFTYWRRKRRGLSLFAKVPEGAVFAEKWTSGRSLRNMLTRMGGARRCLLVALTRENLSIQPHFPFSLFLPLDIYGLEQEIPIANISSVGKSRLMFKDTAIVAFKKDDGDMARFELMLRDRDGFMAALEKLAVKG